MKNKIIGFVTMSVISGLLILIISELSKSDNLKEGSEIPKFEYININGELESFSNEMKLKTLILYYDINCESCKYQLDVIFNNILVFKDVNLILLTSNKFDVKSDTVFYKKIINNANVRFGFVNKNDFKIQFGTIHTPTIFIFNEKNKFKHKINGEAKIEKLLNYL